MTDHAHELRRYSRKIGHPAGDVPSVMLAAADEIERLAARLEAAEKDIAVKEEVIDSLAAVVKRLDAQCDAAERERDECNRRRLEAADHFAAQPAPSFADAYQGAMEEVAIWKRRALKAEDLNRKFVAEINGPAYMGEPAQPAPSIPEGWIRAIDEALIVAHIGVANADDTYEQAKAKLDNLIGFHVDVATDPAVNGGWKLVPVEILDRFPEINQNNYNHDDVCNLNAWGVELVLAAAPEDKI